MKVLYFIKNVCLLSFLTTTLVFSQGYNIHISTKSKNDTILLGHYFAKSDMLIPDDTTVLKNGKGVFTGKKPLAKGIYFIYHDKKKYDVVIGKEQNFDIEIDTADFIKNTRFTGSMENTVFYDFQRYNTERGALFQQLNEQFQKATSDKEKNEIREKMQNLNKERLAYIQQLIDAHPDLYVSKFLNTLIPMETKLPDYPRDAAGNITDSTYVYRWYRAHFFDNLNIYDPDMLRTPLYEEKILEYMTRVIPQHPDTICVEADKILAKAQSNDDIFRCVLVTLFNYYTKSKIMVHENIWVHLADKWYIPYATWSSADYIEKLKAEVEKKKPNLITKMAPPMEMLMVLPPEHFKAAALDTAIKFDLHAGIMIQDFRKEVKSKYTAIFFWDYSCSHCKKSIQELYQVYEEYKNKGLQVITVQTVISKEAKGKWIDFVNEHNMFGWINAWSPYSYKYKDLYDVSMTPILYLLNEKKEIIGKRLVPEQIKDFITTK